MRAVIAWILVVLAVAPVSAPAAAGAAQPSVSDNFACNGANTVGSIQGTGFVPGQSLESAVVQGGAVLARDANATPADTDGSYRSAALTFMARGTYDIQITRADTGAVLASSTRTSFCQPPQASATAHRDCATGRVTGVVVAQYLPRNTLWTLGYDGKSGFDVLGGGPGTGPVPNHFSFTTTDVPPGATVMPMRLLDDAVTGRYPPVPVTATLNSCTVATTPASNGRTSATSTTSHAATTTAHTSTSAVASTTARADSSNAVAIAGTGPSEQPDQTGGIGTRAAAATHPNRLGTWAALLIAAIVLGVAILGVACWYIYRAQRPRRAQ